MYDASLDMFVPPAGAGLSGMEGKKVGRKRKIEVPDVTGVESKILREAFGLLYVLTPEQVCKLLYSAGSLRRVEKDMLSLVNKGVLRRFKLAVPEGKRPFLYTLTEDVGLETMKMLGFHESEVYFQKPSKSEGSYDRMVHLLELNDFLILVKLFAKKSLFVLSVDIKHDLLLKSQPIQIMQDNGERLDVVPDALLDFNIILGGSELKRAVVWVELDRGTHKVTAFKQKIKNILEAERKGAILERFNTEEITFAYVTTDKETDRVKDMRMWVRSLRDEIGPYSRENRQFKFFYIPDWRKQTVEWVKTVDLNKLFVQNVWSVAYGENNLRFALLSDIAVYLANKRKQDEKRNIVDIGSKRVVNDVW